MTAPRFTSFRDAWDWFARGGALVPIEAHRDATLAGRAQLIVFDAPIADAAVLAEIEAVRSALEDIEGLLWLPDEHLHVSLLAVGFQVLRPRGDDELRPGEVQRVGECAAPVLSAVAQVAVEVGPLNVFPDALVLEVDDGGVLAGVRQALRQARGQDASSVEADYLPHVSLASFESGEPAVGLRARAPELRERASVRSVLGRCELVRWWFTGDDPEAQPEREVLRSFGLRGERRP